MTRFLTAGLVLTTFTVILNCGGSSGSLTTQKDISNIVKNFKLCDVKCNGKACECCQTIGKPFDVKVCGSSSLKMVEKSMDLALKVGGEIQANTTVKLDRLLNLCFPVKTKGGQLGICIITTLSDDKSNPNAINICIKVDISIEGVNFIRVSLNCAKFDGSIQIEGETVKGLKTYGYVKVVNGEQLARLVQRIVMGK